MKAISLPRLMLFVVTLATALTMWALVGRIFRGENGWAWLAGAIGAAAAWLVSAGLTGFLVKDRWLPLLTALLSSASALIFFGWPQPFWPKFWVVLAALAAAFVFFGSAFRWLRDEMETRLKPRISRALWLALPRMLTAAALLISAFYFVYPPANFSAGLVRLEIPRPLFNALVQPVTGWLDNAAAPASPLPFGFELPPGLEAAALGSFFGMPAPAAKPKLAEELYDELNARFKAFIQPYHTEVLALLALGLFSP